MERSDPFSVHFRITYLIFSCSMETLYVFAADDWMKWSKQTFLVKHSVCVCVYYIYKIKEINYGQRWSSRLAIPLQSEAMMPLQLSETCWDTEALCTIKNTWQLQAPFPKPYSSPSFIILLSINPIFISADALVNTALQLPVRLRCNSAFFFVPK